ncbi:MAG: hypothetical protein JXX28_01685 [Deltaproteobacteria bacterium]|nr:hypothetical protein [Deltaproteobacteria bacterium]
MLAIPIRYKTREFGIVILDDDGKPELAVVAGRLNRPVPLDRWRELLDNTLPSAERDDELPDPAFARYAWFFQAGHRLIDELGGKWRNAPRRVDAPDTVQSALEAGEPLRLVLVDDRLVAE